MDHLNQLIVNIFDFNQFVIFLNTIPIEITWIVFLFLCLSIIMILLKIFGEIGLYIYTIVAIIVANIQVLKIVKFSFFSDPVALGTILFASTFLCTDILSEYYSKEKAKKNKGTQRTTRRAQRAGKSIGKILKEYKGEQRKKRRAQHARRKYRNIPRKYKGTQTKMRRAQRAGRNIGKY